MQTNQLKRIHPNTKRMIVARGGKRGKTAGRGGKGQSARAGNKRRPQWRDIIKQLPKLRGRGVNSNKSFQSKPSVINVGLLEELFSAGDSVSPTILVEKFAIKTRSGKIPEVKILGDGEVTKKFIITGCFISDSAKVKIEKVGGTVANATKPAMIKNPGPIDTTPVVIAPKKVEAVKKVKAAKKDKPVKTDAKTEVKPAKAAVKPEVTKEPKSIK